MRFKGLRLFHNPCLNPSVSSLLPKGRNPPSCETYFPNPGDITSGNKEKEYFFFNNCFIEVTKDFIKGKEYIELEGKIWEKQKAQHIFTSQLRYKTITRFRVLLIIGA